MKKSKILITMIALLTFMTIPVHAEGWKQDSKGWWYEYTNGTYASNKWEKIDGKWYAFDKQGYMRTGWFQENGKWYYLDASGEMKTGLLEIGKGNWYYFGVNGDMKRGCEIKGTNEERYYFGKDGRCSNKDINANDILAQSNIAIDYTIAPSEITKFELTDGILTVSGIRSGEFSYPISKDCVWSKYYWESEGIKRTKISYKEIKELVDSQIERYKHLEDNKRDRDNFEEVNFRLFFEVHIVDGIVVNVSYIEP